MARIDKYLWGVRLFKTRSLASEHCKKGKVFINDIVVKSSTKINVGDRVTIKKQGITYDYKVKELLENRVGAKLVADFIEDITQPEEIEKLKIQLAMKKEYRKKGSGRPTKKDRRDIDGFKDKT